MKLPISVLAAFVLLFCSAAKLHAETYKELNDAILKNLTYNIEISRDSEPLKFTDGKYCLSKSQLDAYIGCDPNDPSSVDNCEHVKEFYDKNTCYFSIDHIEYGKITKQGHQVALVIIGDDTDTFIGMGNAIIYHVFVVQLIDGNISFTGKFTSDRFNLKKMNLKKNKLELVYEEDKFFDKGQVRQNSAKKTITLDPRINY